MITSSDAFSATIRATLKVGDRTFDVAHMQPGSCRIRNPDTLPPAEAQIILRVEDNEYRYSVFLTEGISADSREVRYEKRG